MSDMVLGTLVLIPFLIFVFLAGYVIYRVKNRRLTSAWEPLVALVNGKVTGDGGGGATSWLSGVYKGREIVASMSPNLNRYESGGDHYNYFDVALTGEPGARDWSLLYSYKTLGIGSEGWKVKSESAGLTTDLLASPLPSLVEPFGRTPQHFTQPSLEYSRRERTLRYRTDVTPQVIPDAVEFTAMLDMLLRASEINRQLNSV